MAGCVMYAQSYSQCPPHRHGYGLRRPPQELTGDLACLGTQQLERVNALAIVAVLDVLRNFGHATWFQPCQLPSRVRQLPVQTIPWRIPYFGHPAPSTYWL